MFRMDAAPPGSSPRYRTVGRYRVYAELASGGMATVHLGCLLGPAGFSKLVAIKCLHEQYALESDFVAMFLDEARLASSIHHPNVVASLDVVAEQGELLVVMEYVHGETLAALLRLSRQLAAPPPLSVVTRVLSDALEGLHAAHVASLAGQCLNIVHRDVSPQNIMVGADGNTRVLDFGIAQAALRSHVTAAGTVKGKLAYMSPEQVLGEGVDARTDVFAAGVVLWEALTGRRLFFAADSRDVVSLVLTSTVPAPSSVVPGLPAALDAVVLQALARDREQRYPTAHAFAEALRRASPEGSRSEVADWVGRVAKSGLDQRLELLQALEASAIHTLHGGPPVVTRSSPRATAALDALATTPELTRATSTTSIAPHQQRARRTKLWSLVPALVGLMAAASAWAWVSASRPGRDPAIATLGLRQRTLAAQPAPPASFAPTATSAPIHVPPGASASPAPSTSERPDSERPDSATVTTVAPRAVPKTSLRSSAPTQPAQVRAKSCTPPYRIDASGVRRVKPECL